MVVFSQNYLPLYHVNIKRAILLLVSNKAEPVDFSTVLLVSNKAEPVDFSTVLLVSNKAESVDFPTERG